MRISQELRTRLYILALIMVILICIACILVLDAALAQATPADDISAEYGTNLEVLETIAAIEIGYGSKALLPAAAKTQEKPEIEAFVSGNIK